MANKSLEAISIERILSTLNQQVDELERKLNGEPIGEIRIADAAITNAKIQNVSADKITTGTLQASVRIGILNEAGDAVQGAIGLIEE